MKIKWIITEYNIFITENFEFDFPSREYRIDGVLNQTTPFNSSKLCKRLARYFRFEHEYDFHETYWDAEEYCQEVEFDNENKFDKYEN